MTKELKLAAILATITLTLAGCASNPDSASSLIKDAEQSQTIVQISEFKKTLDNAEKQASDAIESELDWFATEQVEEANEALAQAKEYYAKFEFDPSEANSSSGLFTSQTNIDAAKENITLFNNHMDKARNLKSATLSTLAEAFEYRTQLRKLDAKSYFPSTVKELESELKKLVDLMANDEENDAISAQPTLVAKQRALEIKTVSKIYLADAQKELDRLVKSDINQHAPKSISRVSSSLNATTAFIATNPRAIDEIKLKADDVLFSAKRAERIALTVKKMKALSQNDYEDFVTAYEKILFRISSTLGAEDNRDLSFEQQGRALVAFIDAEIKSNGDSEDLQQQLNTKLTNQVTYSKLLEDKISALNADLAALRTSLAEKDAMEKPIAVESEPTTTTEADAVE